MTVFLFDQLRFLLGFSVLTFPFFVFVTFVVVVTSGAEVDTAELEVEGTVAKELVA